MATTAGLSLDQFLAKPDTKPASEYAWGRVAQKPMPNRPHSAIQGYLIHVLLSFLNRAQLGRAYPELRCIFGSAGRERVFVPDIVYIAREHLTADLYHRAPPDLAVEILSPDQPMAQFTDKVQFYLLNGVQLVWVIDPVASEIVVLTPGAEALTLMPGDTLDGGDVLPDFSLDVADIFAQIEA